MQEREHGIENNCQEKEIIDGLNQEGLVAFKKESFLGHLTKPIWEKFKPFGKRIALPASALIIALSVACSTGEEDAKQPQEIADQSPKIVFHSDRDGNPDIFVMNPDGSDIKNVTNSPDREDFFPTNPWSSDGSQLVYMSKEVGEDKTFDIFVVDRNGENTKQLTDFTEDDFWPIWSPNGEQIAFISKHVDNGEIYVVNADGSNLENLTNNTATDGVFTPTWSPDGKRIAFTSDRSGIYDLYSMNVDGSDIKLHAKGDLSEHILDLSWSPDGKYIAFEYMITLVGNEIFIVDLENQKFVNLTDEILHGVNPGWSPDSKRVAFDYDSGFISCERDIHLINTDGTNPVNLTNNSEYCNAFGSWSADGKQIVLTSDRDGNSEIYIINSDGTGLKRITENPADDSLPFWSPNK